MNKFSMIEANDIIEWATGLPVFFRMMCGGVNETVKMANDVVILLKQQRDEIASLKSTIKRIKESKTLDCDD